MTHYRHQRGFTFFEVMLAIIIIGIGVAALMQAITSSTIANNSAARANTAANLARNIHEYALGHSLAAIDALNGQTFATAINSDGSQMAGYTGWQQSVQVYKVVPSSGINTNVSLTNASTTRLRRIVVQVGYNGKAEHTQSWLVSATGL